MRESTSVILSGFADEAATKNWPFSNSPRSPPLVSNTNSIRFIDVGSGIKNSMALTADELQTVCKLQAEYGLKVATVGSPIGKVKLLEVDDGTANRYVPFKQYLETEVQHALRSGFDVGDEVDSWVRFLSPQGTDPWQHIPQVVDQLGQIADLVRQSWFDIRLGG